MNRRSTKQKRVVGGWLFGIWSPLVAEPSGKQLLARKPSTRLKPRRHFQGRLGLKNFSVFVHCVFVLLHYLFVPLHTTLRVAVRENKAGEKCIQKSERKPLPKSHTKPKATKTTQKRAANWRGRGSGYWVVPSAVACRIRLVLFRFLGRLDPGLPF